MKKAIRVFAVGFLAVFFVSGICHAAEELHTKFFQGIEGLTGFAQGEMENKGNYSMVPLFVDFDFNLKALVRETDFYPPGLVQFQVEPFFAEVFEPANKLEVGNSFFLKFGIFPETFALQPYVKAGIGVIYINQHFDAQATQFNYIESYVAGLQYSLNKNTSLLAETRFRHLSNADRKLPNHGMNTNFILAGIARRF